MHGSLCGKLYCEQILDDQSTININAADLSERARGLMSNTSALMCSACINKLHTTPSVAAASPAAAAAVTTVNPRASLNLLAAAATGSGTAIRPSSKPKDDFLYSQFIITPISCVDGGATKYNVKCKYCNKFTKHGIKAFNANRARLHITGPCQGVGADVKEIAKRGFQARKRMGDNLAKLSPPTETVVEMGQRLSQAVVVDVDIDRDGLEIIGTSAKKRKVPATQSTLQRAYGDGMTEADAKYVFTAEVRATVARGEPISRLLDPWVQASLILRYPAIGKFLPLTVNTINGKYVKAVDEATTEELESFVLKIPGHINISMDGVSVNRKQKVRLLLVHAAVISYVNI
jgi:hypothetical protein